MQELTTSVVRTIFDNEDDMPRLNRFRDARAYLDDLTERMARYGIKQNQLAKALGVKEPHVSRWFRKEGGANPSADAIFAIERAFMKLKREAIRAKMNQP
jgi:predicted transcriptional regulator